MAKKKAKLKRYDPLAPRFKYQRGFNRAVKRQARSQVDPALGDIRARSREAAGAHTTRNKEIAGWSGGETAAATGGFDRLNTALQAIQGSNSGYQGDASGALNAAMRQQADAAQKEAANLGTTAAPVDPSFLQASQAYGGANQMGLTGDIAGLLGQSAAGITTSGIRGREMGQAEGDRFDAINKGLQGERSDVMRTLPGLREAARASIGQEELGRAGQSFQQNLAGKQFGLDTQRFGEEKKQNKFQRKLARRTQGEVERSNRAGETINSYNAETTRKQLWADVKKAKTGEDRDRAKIKAAGFDNGLKSIDTFIAPTDTEKAQAKLDGKAPNAARDPAQAFDILRRRNGLDRETALKVLNTYPQFRAWVKSKKTKLKKKTRKKAKQIINPFD